LIRSVKPKSFIDIAGNRGLISRLLQDEVEYSICTDLDLNCLDDLWEYISAQNRVAKAGGGAIYPIYMDTALPLPQNYHEQNMIRNPMLFVPWRKPGQRLRCECAIALGILHHLVFDLAAASFELVLECFLSYAQKYLLVEFIDKANPVTAVHFGEERLKRYPWYTKGNFEKALLKYCDIVKIMPSSNDTRTLYLCAIKPAENELE
ncbi:MAG: hypothetical protein FWH02_08175, partial [Oscillospiraceae bacterium]|nr:hypothetical protein [Oscillospiraceae bacterium]